MRRYIALLLALTACTGKKKWAMPPVTIDPAAVNALVPADLKSKLSFAQATQERKSNINTQTFTLALPTTWKQDADERMTVIMKPPAADGYGRRTALEITSNCDGACVPKDWKATSDKAEFARFSGTKVIKDEAAASSRLLIAADGATTYVTYAWWVDGASRYYVCGATLENGTTDPHGAADAFAAACKAVRVD